MNRNSKNRSSMIEKKFGPPNDLVPFMDVVQRKKGKVYPVTGYL